MKAPLQQPCGTRHFSTQPCPRQACVVMAIRPERVTPPPAVREFKARRAETIYSATQVVAPSLEHEIAETLIEQDAHPELSEPEFNPLPYGTRCQTCWQVVRKRYPNAAARAKAFRQRGKSS